ncbi:MAG: hypothetical protein ABIH34_01080, partial [Nanoarchaeota archaeon]
MDRRQFLNRLLRFGVGGIATLPLNYFSVVEDHRRRTYKGWDKHVNSDAVTEAVEPQRESSYWDHEIEG